MKTFTGRVIADGNIKGEAVVTHTGMNTLASYQMSFMPGAKAAVVGDQNNPELFKKNVTGKIICLPKTIGSTTGGMVIEAMCDLGLNPIAYLFSEEIDSLACSGIILARVWEKSDIVCIDKLGDEFLNTVKTGDQLEIKADGSVTIL